MEMPEVKQLKPDYSCRLTDVKKFCNGLKQKAEDIYKEMLFCREHNFGVEAQALRMQYDLIREIALRLESLIEAL